MRIDLPEQKKLNYEMTIPIRWAHGRDGTCQ